MTNFYVDGQGRYVGGFDGADPPTGAILVPTAPSCATDIWHGDHWETGIVVPDQVPMLNAHLVLIEAGWIDGINAYIEAMPELDRSYARAYLNLALTMRRDHPLVLGIPAALGKTEAEVDALFIQAAALPI